MSDRPRLCHDRALSWHLLLPAAHHAARENPANVPEWHPWSDGLYPAHPAIALQVGKTWEPGRQLRVYFLPTVPVAYQAKVLGVMQRWSQYANITFAQVSAYGQADIKVTFAGDGGSWSYMGTDCGMIRDGSESMHFGWDLSDPKELQRVVLHETGHALGCIHEHQNPDGGLVWNVPKVLADYEGPPNYWSAAEIQEQVIGKYSQSQLLSASFDATSIMEYPIAPGEATDSSGRPVVAGWNTDLSAEDKAFIATVYPGAVGGGGGTTGGGGTGSPPPPSSYPKLEVGAKPVRITPSGPGQVTRLALHIDRAQFYAIEVSPHSYALTLAQAAGESTVFGHGRGFFLGRLQPGDYVVAVAPPETSVSDPFGILCAPFGSRLGFL